MKKPFILVTNDDGVNSRGIKVLTELARKYGDVLVVAPDKARSGQSSALTVTLPLLYTELHNEDGLRILSCTGTPTDCVILAMSNQLPGVDVEPDIVLSGINHGSNSSINIVYSGTMGAAIEGALHNKSSIGFSLCDYMEDADFSKAIPFFDKIISQVIANPLPKGVCLNVNAPKGDVKGIKMCRQSSGIWNNEFISADTPFGKKCYWLTGSFADQEPTATDTDEYALNNGYISVQPVKTDLTDYEVLKTLDIH